MNHQNTIKSISASFPTRRHNATKFGVNQILMAITLASVNEMKLLYNTWIRTGSAYTPNGIIDFLKEVKASLTKTIKKVFQLADSGFFSGALFDLLESFVWDHLVKLKNLKDLLLQQTWTPLEGGKDIAICEFAYKPYGWSKSRVLKPRRSVKEYVKVEYPDQKQTVPVYQHVCYFSNLDRDAAELHELYKQRSTSEFCDERDKTKRILNWQAKKQNLRSKTWINHKCDKPAIEIEKISLQPMNCSQLVVEQGTAMEYNHAVF